MNGFEKHNLKHSSASQINMYAAAPCAWAAKYLFGAKFPYGVAPMVGVLTEKVVQDTLLGMPHDEAIELAEKEFRKKTALNTNEKDCARITNIRDMSTLALKELKQYGEPELINTIEGREQQRIELKCNGAGWELPIVGFTDFEFPRHGVLYDLKTTLRIPSVMSPSHQRQGAIYKAARPDYEVRFLYCSPKKSTVHVIENYEETLKEIKAILNRQEKLLRTLSAEQIRELMPISEDSFYWNGAGDIKKEIFNV